MKKIIIKKSEFPKFMAKLMSEQLTTMNNFGSRKCDKCGENMALSPNAKCNKCGWIWEVSTVKEHRIDTETEVELLKGLDLVKNSIKIYQNNDDIKDLEYASNMMDRLKKKIDDEIRICKAKAKAIYPKLLKNYFDQGYDGEKRDEDYLLAYEEVKDYTKKHMRLDVSSFIDYCEDEEIDVKIASLMAGILQEKYKNLNVRPAFKSY